MKKVFADYSFKQIEYGNFMDTDDINEKFGATFRKYELLTKDDVKFISLYSYAIFKRNRT